MFADKVVESVLSTTHCNDFRTFLNKTVGHCGTDARRSTNNEGILVLERHCHENSLFLGSSRELRESQESRAED